ncbi:matrix metalloproteinase-25 isoform X3 [Phocoena sinus]|uniref:matrix metalloproteinase-25 isoform X3 n=2 Tax=Phocoena sinus TaxID=42100 RepID=UPI0013C4162C|nr:matrix metalloproteinase-25 isoform X3 [Phocoena sinus]
MLRLLALLLPLLPPPARAREPSAQDVSLGVDWLTRYGYLPPPHPAQAQLQSPAKLRDAIKVMQRFAGLPETGVLDPVTVAAMHKPRCSLPDVLGAAGLVRRRRRYALSGSVWKKRTLTWRVNSFPQGSVLSQETVRTLMHHALTTWGVESGLEFQEVGSQGPMEPDILIDFARAYHQDSYPFDGQGGTLAHAFFPGEHSISGDTHFDDEETWTFGSKDGEGTDLFAVAVHEFGHALGLGHSSAPNSIMRPFYQGPVDNPTEYRLSQDDLEGLQQLYGKAPQTPLDKPTRKPLAPPPPPPALPPDSPSQPVPDRCDGHFDAIANIRGETFFFKGPWFWRVKPSGQLVSPRPARLHRFWEGLPAQVKVIQAAYARHPDGRILLFSGPAAGGRRAAAHGAGAAPGRGGGRRVFLAAEREDLPDPGQAVLAVRRGRSAPGPRLPARPEPLGGGTARPRRRHRQQHRTLIFPEYLAFPGAQPADSLQPWTRLTTAAVPSCSGLYRTGLPRTVNPRLALLLLL